MKIEFDVWRNARGEVHLTSEDKRLTKPINIRAKDGLVSTSVLETAIDSGQHGSASTMIRLATAERGLEHERALRHDAEADRSTLLATIARLRGELMDLHTDGCGMNECGMVEPPISEGAKRVIAELHAVNQKCDAPTTNGEAANGSQQQ